MDGEDDDVGRGFIPAESLPRRAVIDIIPPASPPPEVPPSG